MQLLNRRAQSTGEYAILFAIVLGAVIGVQGYVRNKLAGKLKQEADNYTGLSLNITRQSDSLSASRADMSSAHDGSLRSDSESTQVVNNPLPQ